MGSQILAVFLTVSLAVPAEAGDILRGGTQMRAPGRTANGAASGAAAATRSQANARDRLARTNQTLAAMRALQLSARSAGQRNRVTIPGANGSPVRLPVVPDGLRPGGLQVANGVPKNLKKPGKGENPGLWIGANLPTENRKGGKSDVTIVQTEQQALLNWQTFNVGKKTTLTFDQSAGGSDRGKWVAFNKVNDPSGRPSQILGSIKADGQVYVINQNGIIFGGSSQVNVHTLVASGLPINSNLISRGLLNNTDAQFLFDAKRLDVLTDSILAGNRAALSQIIDGRNPPRITATIQTTTTGTTPVTTTADFVLTAGRHYNLVTDAERRTTVVLTEAGIRKIQGADKPDTEVKLLSMTAGYFALAGDVVAQRGAQIFSPTSAAKVGGRVLLAGANVRNRGTISTPDGQTILAAGLQIGMNAHAGGDPSLRGVDVFVGAVSDENTPDKLYAGAAINEGLIEIPRANATIAGRSVQQNGAIDGSTSVSLNSRIDLDASYDYIANPLYDPNSTIAQNKVLFVPRSTGVVTLGEGSVTRILPELASGEKATGTEVAIRSQINARGLAVHFAKDAQVLAPNAIVDVKAGKWNFIPQNGSGSAPTAGFMFSTGQIYVDLGATIDVAGTTAVDVPLAQNLLTLSFRGAELADTPLQRDGPFRNTSLTIDARLSGTFNGKEWIGTPLGDATGFLDLIERGVGQMTVGGGEVNLHAGESVVLREGSVIDVSGGWLNNQGGLVKTTKVLQGARLIDIADATPDQVYDGVYDPKFTQSHSKWGVTRTYRHALDLDGARQESDYVQGADAGSISITAASVALDGKLAGNTIVGPRQIRQNALTSSLPKGGKLSLTFRADDPDPSYDVPITNSTTEKSEYPQTSQHAPEVVFANRTLPRPFDFSLAADGAPLALDGHSAAGLINPFKLRNKRRAQVALSPELLTEGGFASLTVDNVAGDILLPANAAIEAPALGSLTLKARNIDIQGSIAAPGGSLAFTAYNLSPYLVDQYKKRNPDVIVPLLSADPDAGRFTLGSAAVLDTAGLTLDERVPGSQPIVLSGGKIEIAAFDARLAAGSLVDVSGGVLVDRDSGVSYGDAGSIAVKAGRDPNVGALFDASLAEEKNPDYLLSGRLVIDGELRGYSGAKGGSLALQAPFVQVGGKGGKSLLPGTLRVDPSFFNRGGFTSFDLSGIGGALTDILGERHHLPGLVIAAGTVIAPHVTSLFANPHPQKGDATVEVTHVLQPRGEREPVSLAFHSLGLSDDLNSSGQIFRGDLVMQDGAAIRTDPRGEVSLTGTTVAVLGTVDAPAGRINVQGSKNSLTAYEQDAGSEQALTTVYLGSRSRLSTRGTGVFVEDTAGLGRRLGDVLPGGTIAVSGNIAAMRGSVLDVSGATGVLDFSPLALDPSASRVVSPRSGLNAPLARRQFVPVRLDSDGGTITLEGGEQLFTDATLLGSAGGPAARGGSLNVSSGLFSLPAAPAPPTKPNLIVTQNRRAIPLAPQPSIFQPGEQTLIGKPVVKGDGTKVPARGYFSADTFLEGGFDSLSLGGVVRFSGPVSLTARGSLKVATGGVLSANDRVNLAAPYVAIGRPFQTPLLPEDSSPPFGSSTFGPARGPGVLTVDADLIDIGTLSLRNIRRANFFADNGDIRGQGTLHIAGDLRFRAGQIYTPSALSFTAIAYDYKAAGFKPGDALQPGSIVIQGSGARPLPLSAGGTLGFYASEIDQRGTLRAPMGTINLGWDGTGDAPVDLIAGSKRKFPITQELTLDRRSITSVSAIDPATGEGALIPYGVSMDGNAWIDPTGADITLGGSPQKSVNLGAARIVTKAGSQVDLRGGGDLYAYRWVEGNLGSRDLLASESSFAVIPDYDAGYAPFAPFNTSGNSATNLSRDPLDATTRDPGYVNRQLAIGDRVFLGEGSGLAPGAYTLLPARYALLPGAYLVTPTGSPTVGPLALPDGSSLVSGYRDNAFSTVAEKPSVFSQFQVLSARGVRERAGYVDFTANRFLSDSAHAANKTPQILPVDAGHLVFQATEKMHLNGIVRGQAPVDGRAAFIDISSPADIIIAGADANLSKKETRDAIVLKSSRLSSWGAESLLVGGVRRTGEEGTVIDVQTGNLTVDNAGSPLSAPEIILAANKNLAVAEHAEISQSGVLTNRAESLTIDGDGTLLRVSSDPEARFSRTNVTTSTDPKMTIGDGALISGNSLTLDSSHATQLSAKATLRGRAVNLSSGQISLRLDDAPDLQPTEGLVLAGEALRSLRAAESLSLLSYSSIDIYGTGEVGTRNLENLALHAAELRGFNDGGSVTFRADHILLDNAARAKSPGAVAASPGQLNLRARVIELGNHTLRIDQFEDVNFSAAGAVYLNGRGRLLANADLDIETPSFFAAGGATSLIRATGDLQIRNPKTSLETGLSSGLGASLTLQGASVVANSDVVLPSGVLTLRATTGDVTANGHLDVGGATRQFNDLVRYSSGGEIKLIADQGDVTLGRRGSLDVAAEKGGGNAGTVSISATGVQGNFTLAGGLFGGGGRNGAGGNFLLDAGSLSAFGKLAAKLNDAGFTGSRHFRVRNGDVVVNGVSKSRDFRLSADRGSIFVNGTVDASGDTGGAISLIASGSLVLGNGSILDASAGDFSNAGKGGAILLEAGSQVDGVSDPTALLDLRSGSKIDLTVAAARPDSAFFGRFTGTLHLRAPQTAAGTDLQLASIDSSIRGASSIAVEGYKIYDLTATNGNLSGVTLTNLKNQVRNNGNLFAGAAGTTSATYQAMHDRLLANNAGLDGVLSIRPGAEIIHRTGNITLGTTTTTNANDDWNFASFRFGPKNAPGVLTMRAAGNLVFNNGMHDGFSMPTTGTVTVEQAYTATLLDANPLLPMNAQSWSYRLTAGADFAGADYRTARSLASLAADTGSLKLGRNVPNSVYTSNLGSNATIKNRLDGSTTSSPSAKANRYQVIRTGSGDIDITAGRDVQLLNQFATIYTAGTKVADPTLGGTFDVPVTYPTSYGSLGVAQQSTDGRVAQFTLGGGDVIIRAQGDITHLTRLTTASDAPLVADSQRQLPNNWLYRRGYVDPATGAFGITPLVNQGGGVFTGGDVNSTSWWVDFSNFFEGVGALGGGNVSLIAGNNVSNVDAVAPTNARLPKTATSARQLVELGGGDVTVRAGNNIDAGVYYVERGVGSLTAGNQITTNATRSPDISIFKAINNAPGEQAWLPTTLFLGKGRFDVSARGDILLGPTANPFLLPEGLINGIWYKTWFSTYASNGAVNVTSLGGDITLRTRALAYGSNQPLLQTWLQRQLLFSTDSNNPTASNYQPWLRLNETSVAAYRTAASLLPPTVRATAFTGDLNLVGTFNLAPAPLGNVEFAAGGAINGLQPFGLDTNYTPNLVRWTATRINLSDASPSAIPGISDPYGYRAFLGSNSDSERVVQLTLSGYLLFLDQLFEETGSLTTALETRQKLHAPGPLHADDPEPLRLYATTGDISGITLFSPKSARIVAGQDIIDNAFYLQNLSPEDVSVVAAGRNLQPYSAASPLRAMARAPGNLPPGTTVGEDPPLAGDIQVAGPGTLVVLAGGALDLGTGASNADGTGSGIVTIGNTRNPYLPFEGSSIIAGAGIGPAAGLASSALDFDAFIDGFLLGEKGGDYLAEIAPKLTEADFMKLPTERRNALALEAFYLVLRDAGRSFASKGTTGYDPGFSAIETLFPAMLTEGGAGLRGNIDTRARDIRTKNGGDISIFAPRGELTLATSAIGNALVPPGVITEAGGSISIFTDGDVDIGIGRIFTLRGGNMTIWSSTGDIAAGAASRTVKSAPPTRVLIDPTSGDVQTDLAGLATGGGIGVLATVAGVPPGDVDLIAPNGVVDAGDAGIRVSGNLNIAATAVLNAENISVQGATTGVPTAPVVAAPNIAGLTSASNATGATSSAANDLASQARSPAAPEETPSTITVEVLGYGGSEDSASL